MDKRIIKLRQQIDTLDEEIIQLLKKRMDFSKKVGKLKEKLDIPVEDKNRENEIIDRLTQQAGQIYPKNSLYGFLQPFLNLLNKSSVESPPLHRLANFKKTPMVGILDQFFIFSS